MSDKPIHVQVAEALGVQPEFTYVARIDDSDVYCSCRQSCNSEDRNYWEWQKEHRSHLASGFNTPRYDTDWSATGPLVEKYVTDMWQRPNGKWRAINENYNRWIPGGIADYPTPLLAICNLIIALGKAGKL